jgi:quaternary ammonium compound-resistance protein SugE
MNWIVLLLAGLFEVLWAVGLKLSNGFTDLKWSVLTVAGMIISMSLLAWAVKGLPIGSAYAVWTGIGAAGTAVLGIWLFQESAQPLRILFLLMIIAGIAGLRLTAGK